MDKQKKIVIQVLPVIVLAIIIMFALIIKSFKTEKQEEPGIINTDIPDVDKKIEENRLKAYENKKVYNQHSAIDISDLKLTAGIGIDSANVNLLPEDYSENKKTLPNRSRSSHYKKIKKQFSQEIKSTNDEYNELLNEDSGEPTEQLPLPTKEKISVFNNPKTVTFNSFTRHSSTRRQTANEVQIYAAVHNQQTVRNRSLVKLRTLESFTFNGKTIPANTFIEGQCTFSSQGRVLISIRSIPFVERPIACNASIYDLDGFAGINIEQSAEVNAGKKAASSSSRKIGNTFSTAIKAVTGSSLGGELASAVSENAINGIADGMNEKIKQQKATLSNNHRVILKIEK